MNRDEFNDYETLHGHSLNKKHQLGKKCKKNEFIFFNSRWPGAKWAKIHQLAKKYFALGRFLW